MQKLTIPQYSEKDILEMVNSNPDFKIGIKLMAMLQIKRGFSTRKLEDFYFTTHSRYAKWHKDFTSKGLEGLVEKPKPGRPNRMDEKTMSELKNVLLHKRPDQFGYNSATWTGPIAIDFVKKKYGITYKKAQIYNIFKKKLGLSHQKGRGFYPEADQVKREQFSETLKKTSRKSPRR